MSALQLAQGTVTVVDHCHCHFLWSGTCIAGGSCCLVAWDKVCDTKEYGSVGTKDLKRSTSVSFSPSLANRDIFFLANLGT